jgi:hypothetical protein
MEKIEALAKFLGTEDLDQIKQSSYDDSLFVVNPHHKKLGDSVSQKLEKVNLVKEALYRSYVCRVLDFTDSSSFSPSLYNPLTRAFRRYCEDLTRIGIHDLVNTLYFLCGGNEKEKDLVYMQEYRDLFDGKEIKDSREEIEVSDGDYLVLDDNEAEQRFEESITEYINDCVLSEIPKQYQSYFDYKAFIKDCNCDGRGHTLASYDGEENEIDEYFIYRTN